MNISLRTSLFAAAVSMMSTGEAASYDHSVGGGSLSFQATVRADGSLDRNWFNPANWSGGQVPGATDHVVLDGDDQVVIDAVFNRGGARVAVGDLNLRDAATLEVINGSILESRHESVRDRSQVIYRSSGRVGESLVIGDASDAAAGSPGPCSPTNPLGCALEPLGPNGGIFFNPTSQNIRTVVLKTSATLDMGLGGTEAAGLTKIGAGVLRLSAGRGYYSTLVTDTAVLDGELRLSTHYDFAPRPGDRFQIMTVNGTRTGEFIGIPEGGYVGCTDDNVGLTLSYRGGDGNDLVISAEQTAPGTCLLLPAVQKVREAAARISARIDRLPRALGTVVSEGVAQTREHILLARQPSVPAASCDAQPTDIAKATCECLRDSGGAGLTACIVAKLPEGTAQTREHILLARQVGVPMAPAAAAKLPPPTTPISAPAPPRK